MKLQTQGAVRNDPRISGWNKMAENVKNKTHLKIYREDLPEEQFEETIPMQAKPRTYLRIYNEASPKESKDPIIEALNKKPTPEKLNERKGDDSGNLTPPGGSGTTGETEEGAKSTLSTVGTTLGLLCSTAFFGGTSFIAHFTDIFGEGEGTFKNLIAFGADCLTTFTGALTISSLLAPTSSDPRENSIINSNFG